MFGHTRPKFGRYHVQRLIGVGMTGPVFGAEDAETRAYVAIKAPQTDLSPHVTMQLVDDLKMVVERLPAHPAIVPLLSAGLEDRQPYLVSEFAPGERLDRALQRDGPGAIADLLPRLQAIAEALDLAAKHGLSHGALHPTDVMVSPDSTVVTGIGFSDILAKRESGFPIHPPYSAPEVEMGADPSNAADQFSLAAIAFEWLFGPGLPDQPNSPLEVPDLPGVDCDVLADAFTIAWSSSPLERFSSCRSFVDAIAASVHRSAEPELPKLVACMPVEADTRAEVSAFTIVQLEPFTNDRWVEAVSRAHMGLMTSAPVEAEPPTPDVDDASPETGMIPEESSHADVAPIDVPQLSHAAETLLEGGLETPIPMSTPRVIDPGGFAETPSESVAEPPIPTAITPLIAQSPQMETPIASGPETSIPPDPTLSIAGPSLTEAALAPVSEVSLSSTTLDEIVWSPVAETPVAAVPESHFPPATPLVTEESALTGTSLTSVSETPLPPATLSEAAPTPFAETPIASPLKTAIAPATALVTEEWTLGDTPSEASLPSTTPSEVAPTAFAETPLASVSETTTTMVPITEELALAEIPLAPVQSANLSEIVPSALAETSIASPLETVIPPATALVTEEWTLADTLFAPVSEASLPSATLNEVAPMPFAETPSASVPETTTPTVRVTEELAVAETPLASVPDAPILSPTPARKSRPHRLPKLRSGHATTPLIAPPALSKTPLAPVSEASLASATLNEVAPMPFVETPSASVPETITPMVPVTEELALAETPLASAPDAPILASTSARKPRRHRFERLPSDRPTTVAIAPPAPSETPYAPTSETSIPSATLVAIARSALAQTPVSIPETPALSSRGSIASTSEFANERVFALATDRERALVLALAATLILGIAVGFAGGFAAAGRWQSGPSQVTAARVPVERTAQVSPREPVTSAQNVETAAMVPAAAGATASRTAALKGADTKKEARVQTRSSAPVKPSRSIGPGSLVIESQPPGAAITVNGMARGKTPLTIGAIPAGTYTVAMALQKFQPVSMTVTVSAGERSRAALTLMSANRQQ